MVNMVNIKFVIRPEVAQELSNGRECFNQAR